MRATGGSESVEQSDVRLVVAQSHELLLDALEGLLQAAGLDVVGRCTRADQLERCLRARNPDVTLLDAGMGDDVGELIRAARRAVPGGRVVLLVDWLDPDVARVTLELEVDGVVSTCESSDDLVGALRRVMAGNAVFPGGWLAAAHRAGDSACDALSPRQLEVLELLAQGLPNEVIAARLFISANTVKFHVAAIYQRLGVRNRVQATHALETLRAAG